MILPQFYLYHKKQTNVIDFFDYFYLPTKPSPAEPQKQNTNQKFPP
jgi:hypothetical protein